LTSSARCPWAVHAHVERTLGVEAEPARGLVELQRAHAQVQEHAPGRLAGQAIRDLAEVRVLEAHAIAELAEARRRPHERVRILVEGDQAAVGRIAAQDLARMAAEADRPVDVQTARPHREQLHRFREEDRLVPRDSAAGHIRSRTRRARGRLRP
jgi:hypothetical protein